MGTLRTERGPSITASTGSAPLQLSDPDSQARHLLYEKLDLSRRRTIRSAPGRTHARRATAGTKERMKEDLKATRWNRLAIRIQVPPTAGVFLLEANDGGGGMEDVLLVGSATNLRKKLLELLAHDELKSASARVIHWVALSIEQARLAERLFIRRYNPPLNHQSSSRYLDILAG